MPTSTLTISTDVHSLVSSLLALFLAVDFYPRQLQSLEFVILRALIILADDISSSSSRGPESTISAEQPGLEEVN